MYRVVIIGSAAMTARGLPCEMSNKNDIDIIGEYDDVIRFIKTHNCKGVRPFDNGNKVAARVIGESYSVVEAEIAWEDSNAKEFMDLVINDPFTFLNGLSLDGSKEYYPSIDALYALKMSHRFLRNSPSFNKTMHDIKTLRKAGAKLSEYYSKWFERREKETYTYAHPKLNVDKSTFFTDEVPYVYDHDSLHHAILWHETLRPTYESFLDGPVKVSKEKWDALSHNLKLSAVYEETCVLALERSIIPFGLKENGRMQFMFALVKVCSSITSGWFREFAWEHYDELAKMYTIDFYENFQKSLKAKRVKLHAN